MCITLCCYLLLNDDGKMFKRLHLAWNPDEISELYMYHSNHNPGNRNDG